MLAILSAPGSRGDVHPMIAIGKQLREIGYDVVISLAETYAELARDAGLEPEPVVSRQRFDELLSDASVWKPIRGPRAILRGVATDFLPLHDEVIRRHRRAGETVLVSHPLDFASRVHRELDPGLPLVDVHLAPSILRTLDDPPRLSPWWFEARRSVLALRATYWLADHLGVDPAIRGAVNRLRTPHGLPPVRRILDQWWLSPDRLVAMYPDWFAPATKQFGERIVHAGFPLYDADDQGFRRPDDRPVIFTGGTANHHSRDFFRLANQVCRQIDCPGWLLSSHAENFPEDLDARVRRVEYVPFGKLLPHCAAIVHHGGIGTTSQALASGTPQLIRPMAYDQFDNASRVERLGCGRWLRRDRDLAAELSEIIRSEQTRELCRQVAARFDGQKPAAIAASAIRQTHENHAHSLG